MKPDTGTVIVENIKSPLLPKREKLLTIEGGNKKARCVGFLVKRRKVVCLLTSYKMMIEGDKFICLLTPTK